MQPFPFFLLFVVGRGGEGGDFGSGSGSKFNCAARVGSDDLGYGPGSGFSFEPVQTSSLDCFSRLGPIFTTPLLYCFSGVVHQFFLIFCPFNLQLMILCIAMRLIPFMPP